MGSISTASQPSHIASRTTLHPTSKVCVYMFTCVQVHMCVSMCTWTLEVDCLSWTLYSLLPEAASVTEAGLARSEPSRWPLAMRSGPLSPPDFCLHHPRATRTGGHYISPSFIGLGSWTPALTLTVTSTLPAESSPSPPGHVYHCTVVFLNVRDHTTPQTFPSV